jgi:hypothetical protein
MANIIEIPSFGDSRGNLCVLQECVPFDIKRVYYIYGVTAQRGGHRHKKTRQLLISVCGSCEVYSNSGTKESNYVLNSPDKGLIVEAEDWHTMDNFTSDCVLLVLASEEYDVNDYIDEAY